MAQSLSDCDFDFMSYTLSTRSYKWKGWRLPRHYLTPRQPAQLKAFRKALKHLRWPRAWRSERGGGGKNTAL